ncbi:sensor histidine kinase [Nocardia rhizosphaerihabitans]|uniref:sensor histidine kinase n=1 Tax=Nocardia rhizosphaerihabitans TaxID=1691570 RepID=UPI003670392E
MDLINSTQRVKGETVAHDAGVGRVPVHERRWLAAGLGVAAACVPAVWATVVSWSVMAPTWWEELPPRLVGVVVLVTGLMVWIRLPSPRTGQLIVLGGGLYYLQFFRAAEGVLFALGFCLAYLWTAVAAHVLLVWPSGRLGSTVDRGFIVCCYCAAVGTQVIRYFLDDPQRPWALHLQQPGSVWGTIGSTCAAGMFVVSIGLALRRWLSSPVRRLPSGPVWAGIAIAASVKFAEAAASLVPTPFALRLALGWLFTVATMVLMPALYLIGWLYRRFGHRRVVDLLLSLQDNVAALTDPASLQQTLRRTLGDPTLVVAYRHDSEGYVDVHGLPTEVDRAGPGRAVTEVRRSGAVIGVIEHDEVLSQHREVIDAAVAAVGLAIENTRLYVTLHAQLEQIRASRLRLTQTAFEERLRIQRDLHDGAQQRFFVVLMLLDRAQRMLAEDPNLTGELSATVRGAHGELTTALRSLRELIQGIYPTVLADHGLAAAIANLVDQAPIPVDFTVTSTRWARHIEMTAYFVVSEALANVYKHAAATHVRLEVGVRDQLLITTIIDNGRGGTRPTEGLGLASLQNRIEAVGGTLSVRSKVGQGTTVIAAIPHPDHHHPHPNTTTELS